MKIHQILASIITMSGLYSINLFIMGASSNVSLIGSQTIFTMARNTFQGMDYSIIKSIIALLFSLVFWGLLALFFKTYLGLSIRATGNNPDLVRSSSINVDAVKTIALAVSNGCIALSGAVIAQFQGYADISSGAGILVIGLASVIIGEVFMGRRSVTLGLLSAIIGSTIYRFIIALALSTSFFPAYGLKLVSAIIVGIALSIPAIKEHSEFRKAKMEARKHA
jgi:putative ABC transport system permease protein